MPPRRTSLPRARIEFCSASCLNLQLIFIQVTFIHQIPHHQAYKNLSSKTRLGVGVAVIAWGAAGLMLTDPLEKSLGLTPTEEDKAELDKYTPKIVTVVKDEKDGK
ncbi:hypothetical protein FGRA07_06043 [Fusarium graminearum]|nr:hypothetical protein FGRA07_06043 [Fusarium graminearum]